MSRPSFQPSRHRRRDGPRSPASKERPPTTSGVPTRRWPQTSTTGLTPCRTSPTPSGATTSSPRSSGAIAPPPRSTCKKAAAGVPSLVGGEMQRTDEIRAPERAITYCVVPRELAPKLLEPLRRHFHEDPSIEVIAERRDGERRL